MPWHDNIAKQKEVAQCVLMLELREHQIALKRRKRGNCSCQIGCNEEYAISIGNPTQT